MPQPKQKKRRVEFPSREDNGPTVEQRAKAQYRTTNGTTRLVSGVELLRQAGEIDDDASDAAYRWLCEYVWSLFGYFEYRNPRNPDGLKHDQISFNLTRAVVGKRIQMISERMGPRAHVRLVMLLVEGMTFKAIGARIWPDRETNDATKRAQAQCAFVLGELPDTYKRVRSQEEQDIARRQHNMVDASAMICA